MRAARVKIGACAIALAACATADDQRGTSAATIATSGATGSSGASGTSGGCEDGIAGCPCYGNGTCNAGLTCVPEVNLCIPEDCTPGSEGCTCVDGQCLGNRVCEDGLCGPANGGSTTTATSETSATTSDISDSAMSITSGVDSGPLGCDDPEMGVECTACSACASGPGGPCNEQWSQCEVTRGCKTIAECCTTSPDDCSTCCSMATEDMVTPAYLECIRSFCLSCGALACQ